jgi:DNA-binding NarL/FixJ family response regulator
MQQRRMILANEPRLLRSMLGRALRRVPGLEILGETTDVARLASMLNQMDPQWVVVSLLPNGKIPSVLQSLLQDHPSTGIVGLAADGSQAKIWCAGLLQRNLLRFSLDELLATLFQPFPGRDDGGRLKDP